MSLLTVAYPGLSAEDWNWIQSIREEHDELYYHVIDPHFTIIFPCEFGEEEFISHVTNMVEGQKPIDFFLRCAVMYQDAFIPYSHVFLVPDEGFSDIVFLHDMLYTGVLQKELRLDIPFTPHIGIANSKDVQKCKDTVDMLNAQKFEIAGRIEELDIIRYFGDRVETIKKIPLQ